MGPLVSRRNIHIDPDRRDGCSCWKEPGCWGSAGWHFYATLVPAQELTRSGPGGVKETYLRPPHERHHAYERCEAYWSATERRRDGNQPENPL